MITFGVCLVVLIAAYFLYGGLLSRVAKLDKSADVPSKTMYDGVDYMPLPRWRIFLIQLLNIAGTGPIFGAILGACYGPVAFLWITLGGILMGAMHDFVSGFILVRHDGLSLPEVIGKYLGKEPIFEGEEGDRGILCNASKCVRNYGYPDMGLEEMMEKQAAWVLAGGRQLGKPTHFEESKGKF